MEKVMSKPKIKREYYKNGNIHFEFHLLNRRGL